MVDRIMQRPSPSYRKFKALYKRHVGHDPAYDYNLLSHLELEDARTCGEFATGYLRGRPLNRHHLPLATLMIQMSASTFLRSHSRYVSSSMNLSAIAEQNEAIGHIDLAWQIPRTRYDYLCSRQKAAWLGISAVCGCYRAR